MGHLAIETPTRAFFVYVFNPRPVRNPAEKAKYGMQIMIPKKDISTVAAINKLIEEAKAEGSAKKWGGSIPYSLKTPLRDGDAEKPNDPNYNGMWFINANSSERPQVFADVKGMRVPVTDPVDFYSGCWCFPLVSFYPFKEGGNSGIAVGLNGILKISDAAARGLDESKVAGAPNALDAFKNFAVQSGGASFM